MTLEEFQSQPYDWQWLKMWDDGENVFAKIVDDAYVVTMFKVEGIYVLFAVNRREKEPFIFESYDAEPDFVEIKGQPFDIKQAIAEENAKD